MATTATAEAVGTVAAETAEMASSAGARNPVPPPPRQRPRKWLVAQERETQFRQRAGLLRQRAELLRQRAEQKQAEGPRLRKKAEP